MAMDRSELENYIKRASDRMRADDNTKSTERYLEHFSWLLFLKVWDDVEHEAALRAEIDDHTHDYVLDVPHRWATWTRSGLTGPSLIAFVEGDLFPYLRDLHGSPRAEKIAEVFAGLGTIMKSGYVLAEVIDIIDKIEFLSLGDLHAMSVVYETLLAQMGNDSGWSGELYTPRPVIEFMTWVVDPEAGERIYDPCSGSSGFLVSAYEHVRRKDLTVEEQVFLNEKALVGREAGALAFLLGLMNLLLHGVSHPHVTRGNTLERDVRSVPASELFDVVMTNPPFGGTEQATVQENFPLRSSSTQLLFMQHIVAHLKRDGRAAVVLPESFLSNDGVFETFRSQLLRKWNVETIVGLPAKGIFYKPVKTALVFIDGAGPTKDILFVDVVPPAGQKNFTKRKPLSRSALEPYLELVARREASENSWLVAADTLAEDGFDLRPRRPDVPIQASSEVTTPAMAVVVVAAATVSEQLDILRGLPVLVAEEATPWDEVPLGTLMAQRKVKVTIKDHELYRRVRVALHGRGLSERDEVAGSLIKTKTQYEVEAGQFLVAEIDAKVGGMGMVPPELHGAIVSSHYFAFDLIEPELLRPGWLDLCCRIGWLTRQLSAKGATNYASVRPAIIEALRIPLPPPERQDAMLALVGVAQAAERAAGEIERALSALTDELSRAAVLGLVPSIELAIP